jgi:hypothetical protein
MTMGQVSYSLLLQRLVTESAYLFSHEIRFPGHVSTLSRNSRMPIDSSIGDQENGVSVPRKLRQSQTRDDETRFTWFTFRELTQNGFHNSTCSLV